MKPICIIAWGNCGRSDDGVALRLAERLQERYAAAADIVIDRHHQLAPELAADLHCSRAAIFIDADVRGTNPGVLVSRLAPLYSQALSTHHCPPDSLLALAEMLYGTAPPAYLVAIRAMNLEFGDALSASCAAALEEAQLQVVALVERLRHSPGMEGDHARTADCAGVV